MSKSFICFFKKSSSKNNRHNWNGCVACVPEQKWVGSRFAACLEGQRWCSSSESISSQLSPGGLSPWVTLPDTQAGQALGHPATRWVRWAGRLAPPPARSALQRTSLREAGARCPAWMLQSRDGQALRSDVRNLRCEAGWEKSTARSCGYLCPS